MGIGYESLLLAWAVNGNPTIPLVRNLWANPLHGMYDYYLAVGSGLDVTM